MTEKKNWGSTVLGWFVVKDEGGTTETTAESVESSGDAAETPSSSSPGPAVEFVKEPPQAPGGRVDFEAVYEAAGIGSAERERFLKAAQLLGSLPQGTEPTVKKQIVEASLKAFGVPIEKIIEAGVQEVQALEGYLQAGAADTKKVCEEAQKRVLEYEEEIRRIKRVMDERVQEQQAVKGSCNEKKLDIQRVLEFFGQEAVARVVRDSPRLIDPSAPRAGGPPSAGAPAAGKA